MDSDALVQMLQKGFRVTLGATASLIEILQDPDRRDENLGRLTTDWDGLAEEWAIKGEMTEQEARNFVETILTQQTGSSDAAPGATTPGAANGTATGTATETPPTTTTSTGQPAVQTDVQELTAQIAAIRAELEKLRQQD